MKKLLYLTFLLLLLASCSQEPSQPSPTPTPETDSVCSRISYQLLVYSFSDSNGDGIGDFKGIENRLDYLKSMGVQALWLSPIHPSTSYHGYDVEDYSTVNPDYGTMNDFKSLLSSAHAKGIKIYIDYVLNHSSKEHPWFINAKSAADSKYRDFYILSSDPKSDLSAGRFPMLKGTGYNSNDWYQAASGSWDKSVKVKFTLKCNSQNKPQTLTVEQVDTVMNTGQANSGLYLWWGDPGRNSEFYAAGNNTYTLSLDLHSPWGVLVRTSSTQWDSYKYGAPAGSNVLSWGTPLTLSNTNNSDILLPGMTQLFFYAMFGSYMPDINYGDISSCEESAAFKAITDAADQWIEMGVDGFRLDAVKHIYPNANNSDNPTFLKKFHDHCNDTWHKQGGTGDFYMVGEQFSEAAEVAPYYKGIPALFEFSFYWRLTEVLNSGDGSSFVEKLQGYQRLYAQNRTDYIEATKLSNHDEDRAGSTLGRNEAKMKLAGAMLLTCTGEPYIYQGEELGYWGTKANGDEYVRTPILWNSDLSGLADKALDGKVDRSMLTASISVANQQKDESSVWNVYKKFGVLRSHYKALANGSLGYCAAVSGNRQIAAWYREYDGQKILVLHNVGGGQTTVNLPSDNLKQLIGSNGTVTVSDSKVTLGAYSSAVFLQ